MDLLDRLLGHDAWTTHQLLDLCLNLSDEQLDTEFDIGHRSIRATIQHVIHNMEVWSHLIAGDPVVSQQQRANNSIPELQGRLTKASHKLARVARSIADRNSWNERWTDPIDGITKTNGGAIAHIITHSMHHRAQLLYLLRMTGVTNLPEGDVLSWELRENAEP